MNLTVNKKRYVGGFGGKKRRGGDTIILVEFSPKRDIISSPFASLESRDNTPFCMCRSYLCFEGGWLGIRVALMWNTDKATPGDDDGAEFLLLTSVWWKRRDARKCPRNDFCFFKAYMLVGEMDHKLSNSDNTVGKRKHRKAVTWGWQFN